MEREPRTNRMTNMKAKTRIGLTSGGTARRNLTRRTAIASLAPTKRILLTRRSPAYWRVTFNHPPLNIFGPETIPQLDEIITALETDEQSGRLRSVCQWWRSTPKAKRSP